jgi:hypothetical protein
MSSESELTIDVQPNRLSIEYDQPVIDLSNIQFSQLLACFRDQRNVQLGCLTLFFLFPIFWGFPILLPWIILIPLARDLRKLKQIQTGRVQASFVFDRQNKRISYTKARRQRVVESFVYNLDELEGIDTTFNEVELPFNTYEEKAEGQPDFNKPHPVKRRFGNLVLYFQDGRSQSLLEHPMLQAESAQKAREACEAFVLEDENTSTND